MLDCGYILQASIISSVILSMTFLPWYMDQTGDRINRVFGQIFRCSKILQFGILLKSSSQVKIACHLAAVDHAKSDIKRSKNGVIANKETPCQS